MLIMYDITRVKKFSSILHKPPIVVKELYD